MLGGHEPEGGGTEGGAQPSGGPPPRSSSLTEALAAEAVKAADSAPRRPTEPPRVGYLALTCSLSSGCRQQVPLHQRCLRL